MLHSAFMHGGAQPRHDAAAARLSFTATGSILASVRRVGVRAGAAFRAVGAVLQTSEAREARIAVVVEAAVALTAAVLNLLMKRVRLAASLTPLSARALSEVVSAATGWCRETLSLLLAIEPLALGPFAVSLGHDVVACSRLAGLWAGMNAELQALGARTQPLAPTAPPLYTAPTYRVTHATHLSSTAAEPTSSRPFTPRPASYATASPGHPTGQARDNRCGSAAATTPTDGHSNNRASPTTLRHAPNGSTWVTDCPVTTDRNRGSPRGRRGGSAGMTRTHSCSPLATRTPTPPAYLMPTPPALRPPRPLPPQPPPSPPASARSVEGELESIRSEGISMEEVREGRPNALGQFWEEQYTALKPEREQSVASSSTAAERTLGRDQASPPRLLRHTASIVGQFMRTVSQAEGGWTEERLSEERGVQDPELPASSSSIAAERQRNRSAQRRGSNQRGGSVQPHMAPRPVRPAPTLREQERLSCLVELGLLSFGSLAFEIQRRAAIAQAAAAPPVRTGSTGWITSGKGQSAAAITTTRAVTRLMKNNAKDMTPA